MIRHDESRSWVTPMSCFHAAPSAPKFKNADRHRYVMRTTIRIQVVLVALLVGGLLPPHNATNNASFNTTRLSVVESLK